MKTIAMKSWRLLVLLVSVVAVTACDDDDDDDNGVDPNQMTATEFVQRAAESDVFEITTGQMAADSSENADVQALGQMLVQHHTLTSDSLMTIAQENNINITMPTPATLPQERRDILTRLEGETGEEFDLDFAQVQVEAHEDAIALYEEAIDELDNEDLRNFAEQTLPILQAHLQAAQDLRDQLEE